MIISDVLSDVMSHVVRRPCSTETKNHSSKKRTQSCPLSTQLTLRRYLIQRTRNIPSIYIPGTVVFILAARYIARNCPVNQKFPVASRYNVKNH